MPNDLYTQAAREAIASAVNEVMLNGLTLRHSAWAQPLHCVQAFEAWTLTLETQVAAQFLPIPFKFSLPEVSEGASADMVVEVDNVPRDVSAMLDVAVAQTGLITMEFRQWLARATGAPVFGPLILTVHSAEATATGVTLRAGHQDINNRAFPNWDYTASRFPGLVA